MPSRSNAERVPERPVDVVFEELSTSVMLPATGAISVGVDNESGVLARVVGLFSGRGYNIESLAVAEVDATKNI